MTAPRVFITGAQGYLGRSLVERLGKEKREGRISHLCASDVYLPDEANRLSTVEYVQWDVRNPGLANILKLNQISTVVHLASIVTPKKDQGPEFAYQVDVLGTQRVIDACVESHVSHLVVSSSGAAYGYHADNPEWLKESDPLRGNKEFPYSYHKRLVEEMLSLTKEKFPPLKQTLFRVSTILGRNTKNQITDLFEKPFLIGIRGSKSPFVFIWDEDLVEIFTQAILLGKTGIYNAAGDGAMSVDEIAQVLQKRVIWFSATLLGSLLWVLHRLGLSQYDHEQVRFLQYRPVLSNDKLKGEFGYRPKKSSRETFLFWKASRSRS